MIAYKVKYKIYYLFFLIGIVLTNPISAQDNNWTLKKNNNGIKVYTRTKEGSNILEFKAITALEASNEDVMSIINDIEGYTDWMADLEVSKLLKRIDERNYIVYDVLNLPWPFEDRDFVLQNKIEFKDSKTIIHIKSKADYIPEKDGITRIHNAEGKWIIENISENKIKISYYFFSDPEGSFPAWLINMFIVDNPYTSLYNLKTKSIKE